MRDRNSVSHPSASPPYAVYSALACRFGPQGWWPVTPEGGIKPVYHPGRFRPKNDAQRFEIAVGAILTQNTAWLNAERAIVNLNLAGLLSPMAIMAANREKLEDAIRPSGYFSQKAKKLSLFSKYLLDNRPEGLGRWLAGPLIKTRQELLSLWGIGPETADSILLYAGTRPVFVVDAYTLRLGRRMGWFGRNTDYSSAQEFFMGSLPGQIALFNEFHALIVALGKEYCGKTGPLCAECPVEKLCGKRKPDEDFRRRRKTARQRTSA